MESSSEHDAPIFNRTSRLYVELPIDRQAHRTNKQKKCCCWAVKTNFMLLNCPFWSLTATGHNMLSLFAQASWKWLWVSQEEESHDMRVSRWWQNFHFLGKLFSFIEETVGTTNDAVITGLFVLFVCTLCLQWELILLTIKELHWNQRSCHWL